ncbi:MAG TPA: extracellular solute-binding protein [Thermoguttaceae bacterium]|nr:extracellular solute-binding protein [Thermoguttaceae bacterium]
MRSVHPPQCLSQIISDSTPTRVVFLAVFCSFLTGCPKPADQTEAKRLPLEGVTLRLLVVDDPALAAALGKVRGEWRTQTGATLEVTESCEDEFLAADKPKADAAICGSSLLGPLAEGEKIVEIPAGLRADDQKDWTDLFELARGHEVVWGSKTLAVPFGSPVLVCYYRADLLAALGQSPPETWEEYQGLAGLLSELLEDRERLTKQAVSDEAARSGTMEPLGPGWGGLMLLARAASGVQHPDNFSTWFDIRTMEPLIAGPPVVRALVQLVETAKYGPADQLTADPAKVRAAFWRGKCGLAVSWPTAAAEEIPKEASSLSVGVTALPGSREHFNVDHGRWETRKADADPRVPLLDISGRIGVVLVGERSSAAGELLVWLSALQGNPPPAARSPWTTLFRRSQAGSPADWVEKPMSTATATDYAKLTRATFESQQWTASLRIPGRREYLKALDEAVAAAVRGEKAPAAALQDAAQRWREITERLGVERQQAAYLRSLGLEP